MAVTLRYSEVIGLNPGATPGIYTFHCNDVYDPNVTGVGHQPRGFDDWMRLYSRFRVVGSRITAHFSTNDTNANDAIVGIVQSNDAMTTITLEDYLESRENTHAVISGTGDQQVTLSKGWSLKKAAPSNMHDVVYEGTVSGSPQRTWKYNLFAANTVGVSDIGALQVTVVIDYAVLLLENLNPSIS